MHKLRLTEARVKALKPRNAARDIRDADLRGCGVRIPPTGGKRFFVHCQHRGERVWKIVGDAAETSVRDARSRAREAPAAIRFPSREEIDRLLGVLDRQTRNTHREQADGDRLLLRAPRPARDRFPSPAARRKPVRVPRRRAVMNGVPVPVVSRLLGHSSVGMTLRYAHPGDRDVEEAAERIGLAIDAIMDGRARP